VTIGRALGLCVAGLLVLMGGVWTFQGLGYIDGSFMSETWAVIGPIVAGLGVALGIVVVQGRRE
jgi:cytochrome bd-type quinol oxidase subunit 2